MKILVVDDNPDNRQLLKDIVTSMGHTAIPATDGEETLQLTYEHMPDLIVLDVNMPGMNGFEVLNRLKADSTTNHISVLMLTALNAAEHRVQGLEIGADDYLTKPFNPRELMERIKTRLRQKEQTDALRERQKAIRVTFERFVAPAVVEQLLHDPGKVALGGKLQEITVLFADLEGFTRMSERTQPEKLLAILNRYHTLMVNIIREQGGTIDKFMGDGLMALYNTPLEQPDHAMHAVRSALDIRTALNAFHAELEPEFRLPINFGIHSGGAVVGNVGSPDLMNFTAIGDTVNIGWRLQEMCSGGRILISEASYRIVNGAVSTQSIGLITIKGRETPVLIYEVTGLG
jgi:class 3 adenylate cyclase